MFFRATFLCAMVLELHKSECHEGARSSGVLGDELKQ